MAQAVFLGKGDFAAQRRNGQSCRLRDLPDTMRVRLRYIQASVEPDCNPKRPIKGGLGGWLAIDSDRKGSISGHGGDDAAAVHLAHAAVNIIRDIKIPRSIDINLVWIAQPGLGGRSAVAAVAAGARASHRCHAAGGVHLDHPAAIAVRYVEVAGAIQGEVGDVINPPDTRVVMVPLGSIFMNTIARTAPKRKCFLKGPLRRYMDG